MAATTVSNVIPFTPYRGEVEPITKVLKSQIIIHARFLEMQVAYDFVEKISDGALGWVDKPNFIREYSLWNKDHILIRRCSCTHESQTIDPEICQLVEIVHTSGQVSWFRAKPEEVDNAYKMLKAWMLA